MSEQQWFYQQRWAYKRWLREQEEKKDKETLNKTIYPTVQEL